MPRQYTPLVDRFWQRVNKTDRCWLWIGNVGRGGYGYITHHGNNRLAHRVSYELAYGSIPENMDVLHCCDTPGCVRPDHLWVGTHSDNMQDKMRKGRSNNPSGESHWQAKLNWQQVREIRQKRQTGRYTLIELGKEYSVHLSLISLIAQNKIWKE